MTTPFRGVLIGCGFFARNHMQAWAGLPGAQIVGVCDLDPARAATFAQDFRAASFTDAAAMLAQTKPDFVDIATTVSSHRVLVELAAKHARLVICQKPFAETLTDGQAMFTVCSAAGIPLIVHENFRWQAPFRALKAALDVGDIGKPRFLRLSFRHAFDIYANQPYLAEVPDLALSDVGLHLFDLARHLMGDVTRVSCETQRRNNAVKGQDAFLASLRHASGAVSSVECSFYSHLSPDPFPETLALLEGDAGTLELTQGYCLRLHHDGRVTETDVEPPVPFWGQKPWHGVQESVVALQAHALDVLAGHASPQPSGAHNLETLALTLAAIRSAHSGQTIDIAAYRAAEGG
jgi:D-apiose dehydrogenase